MTTGSLALSSPPHTSSATQQGMSFRTSMLLGVGAIALLFVAILGYCIYEISKINGALDEVTNSTLPHLVIADDMSRDVIEVQQFLTDVSATHDVEGFQEADKYARSFKSGITEMKRAAEENPEQIKLLETLDVAFDKYYENGKRMAHAYIESGIEEGNRIMEDVDKDALTLSGQMQAFRDKELTRTITFVSDVEAQTQRASEIGAMLAGLGLVMGLAMGWMLCGILTRKIGIDPFLVRNIAHELELIAKGDLTRKIAVQEGDKTSLKYTVHSMQSHLRDMIQHVSHMADSISQAVSGLKTSSEKAAYASLQQNEATSSVAAAVEEFTVTIDQVSGNAAEADSAATLSGKVSRLGNEEVRVAVNEIRQIENAVNNAVGQMDVLGGKANEIGAIVGVIKDVAEQTNLLALNAAIEAARAGESGRGFAVVADEVRKLAERTSKSAAEITAMITSIQETTLVAAKAMQDGSNRVSQSVGQAERAGESMTKVSESSNEVMLAVSDISASLREQRVASTEISRNVERIAQMAEENSAAVSQVSSAAATLEQMAGDLKHEVARFRV